MDLGQFLQNILNSLGGLGGLVQAIFPQITGIGSAVNAAIWGANQMTNNSINNFGMQVQNTVNSVGWNIQSQINQATATLGNMVNQGVNTVNGLIGNFSGGIFQGLAGITNFISQASVTTNQILNNAVNMINNQSNTMNTMLGIEANLANPVRLANEQNFWTQLGQIPDILKLLWLDLPTGIASNMAKEVGSGVTDLRNSIEDQWAKLRLVINNFITGKYKDYNEAINDMERVGLHAGWVMFAINLATIALMVAKLGTSKTGPIFEVIDQMSWAENPTKLLDIGTIVELNHRGILTLEQITPMLKKHGLSEQNIYYMMLTADRYPDISVLTQYLWRGKLSLASYRDTINKMGLLPGADDMYEEIAKVVPNPSDLTRIADKRIWGLNLPEKYGQYSELPAEYVKFMKMNGLDEQFTRWIWAAHWQLPSPNQIFEMYQRGKITQEDMNSYLALTDWLPFFRDKLLQISYNPLTRVDIRRMYGLGMFNHAELLRRYQDIGFSPADSELMAQFTERYETSSDNDDITKLRNKIVTAVEGLYVRNKLSRSEAVNRLIALGKTRQMAELTLNYIELEKSMESTPVKVADYKTRALNLVKTSYLQGTYPRSETLANMLQVGLSNSEAEAELQYLDLEKSVKAKQDIILTYETQYLNGAIDKAALIATLSQQGLNISEINAEVAEADLKLAKKFKMPSEKQVQNWHTQGLVSDDYVLGYLSYIGYPETVIPLVAAGDYGIGVQ